MCPDLRHSPGLCSGHWWAPVQNQLGSSKMSQSCPFPFPGQTGPSFCKLRLFWEGFQGVSHQQGSHGHNATVCFWAPWGHGSSVLWMPGRQDGRDCGRRMSAGTFVSWAQRPLPRALHAEATVPSPLCLGARWEVAEIGFFAALCLLLSTVLFSVVTT